MSHPRGPGASWGPSRLIHPFSMVLLVVHCLGQLRGQVLNPPSFNLAEGRKVHASSTCGEGMSEPELYCKLVGANWFENVDPHLIQGQACDYCDPTDPKKSHKAEYAIDGTERWWQSPPLSRGLKYNEVNLTIDLGQEFHVAYVFIKMACSPRPGVWALERSLDYGKTFIPWQYFADTYDDCTNFFGHEAARSIVRDDSVICETKFSKVVPLENGEIAVSLLNDRPSSEDFSRSQALQEFTKATNVRLRLMRPKTTLGHLISVARADPTVTRRYFYSIKDINIGGRCVCNGHAKTCDIIDPSEPQKLYCKCEHETRGPQCEQCKPWFVQKKWKPATVDNPNSCEPCNCLGHSSECYYDEDVERKVLSLDASGRYEGGGVCLNCNHNTFGINCDKCIAAYYRPFNRPLNATNACEPCRCDLQFSTGNCAEGSGQCECKENYLAPHCDKCTYGYYDYPECKPCDCFVNGTYGEVCELRGGQCPCLPNYSGKFCRACDEGFYGFPNCLPCECNNEGSVNSDTCDLDSGACKCRSGFGGRRCDQCDVGFFQYPYCNYCTCDPTGTTEEICDKESGQCICKPGHGGVRCDQCAPGYHGFPNCTGCDCDKTGSVSPVCISNGKCHCLANFGGLKCSDCSPGHYKYPECLPCSCDQSGSHGLSCDGEGHCVCRRSFDGDKCQKCKEGFYNYPLCEECNCNPAGVVVLFKGCGSVAAGELCKCKERVTGRICDQCEDLYWNLRPNNPLGCEDCNCHRPGTISGVGKCEDITGQCVCKTNAGGRVCDQCRDGSFGLDVDNLFGCTNCDCDVGGAISNVCDKHTGQCPCRPRINGRKCNGPLNTYYYPTLYQHQYEIEDGQTVSGSPARFGYDENTFPDYSWRGYAIFSEVQKEVLIDVPIHRPSFYKTIFRYVNPGDESVVATLTLTPDLDEQIQTATITFEPSKEPKVMLVASKFGQVPTLVLNPGRWTASLKVDKPLLVDYMVFMPEAYYEPKLLQDAANRPCKDNLNVEQLCRHYSYPKLSEETSSVRGEAGYINIDDKRVDTAKFEDIDLVKRLQLEGTLAKLDKSQPKILLNLRVPRKGKYVIIVLYHNPMSATSGGNEITNLYMEVATTNEMTKSGQAVLTDCPYSFVCRQVVTDKDGRVAVFDFDSTSIGMTLKAEEPVAENMSLGLESVAAIPFSEWYMDYVTPQFVCVMKDAQCIDSSYPQVSESSKVEFEKDQNSDRATSNLPAYDVFGEKDSQPLFIYLNDTDSIVDVRGKVPHQGMYKLVVHYNQPNHPSFELDAVIQNGQFYNAMVPLKHCPSTRGCRALVHQRESNSSVFSIMENFILTLKQPKTKSVFLDYVLAIPVESFDEDILDLLPQDKAVEFIKYCGKTAFYVGLDASDFCKESVFSLTSEYNGGAVNCKCNVEGSKSYECQAFGGQCPCKDNVIGRQCTHCKTGYFGFPDCKPCNCPSTAYCQPVTGQCVCPPRVTGDSCDVCVNLTYGYHPLIGCEECKCNSFGVDRGNLQCDLTDGQCPCKTNVVGRQCDHCKPGYWSFPYCQLCNCDVRGVIETFCDQDNAACFCKKNVYGEFCDTCQPDAYYLEETNPVGCSKCFCFGTTDRCRSSSLFVTQIMDMEDDVWGMVRLVYDSKHLEAVQFEKEEVDVQRNRARLEARFAVPSSGATRGGSGPSSTGNNVYFSAPATYLGNRVTSYGGRLRYSLLNVVPEEHAEDYMGSPAAFEVVITGNNVTIIYQQNEQPLEPNTPFDFNVSINERDFRHLNRNPVTREQLMMVLVNVNAIYIRGSYFEPASQVHLISFMMDTTSDGYIADAPMALRVEQCFCPRNYKGSSCEECNDGFYRAQAGPYLGFCVPCQCNGHSDECDVQTGKCFNCKHNTVGDHCDMCSSGYHGDARKGTPYDCLICACPLPLESNNFATSCEVSKTGSHISCQCKEGYVEPLCDVCSAGFYGRPLVPGDYCKNCNCSGNIDPSNPGSCDSFTGQCVLCLNNSSGPACELCANGYYGDAVAKKDCKECDCDKCGSSYCDHMSGQCNCKPNVVGQLCDQCALDHYGLNSCKGCRSCECGVASKTTSCELESGQCECQPGATGRTCAQCELGYWKYSPSGCVSCNCAEKYSHGAVCNQATGQCQCLSGVIGDKCDSCPHRWVFIEKTGCRECGPCVHFLLDDTDELASIIDPMRVDLQDASTSVFAYRRLEHVKEKLATLSTQVQDMIANPNEVNLGQSLMNINSLEDDVNKYDDESYALLKQSVVALDEANVVRKEALAATDLVKDAIRSSSILLNELKELETGFNAPSASRDVEGQANDAERILSELKDRNFETVFNNSKTDVDEAANLMERIEEFTKLATINRKHFNETNEILSRLRNLLDELMANSRKATNDSVEAEKMNLMARKIENEIDDRLKRIKETETETEETLEKVRKHLEEARSALVSYAAVMEDSKVTLSKLEAARRRLVSFKETNKGRPEEFRPLVQKMWTHEEKLHKQAVELENTFRSTKYSSKNAVKAANSYNSIIEGIENASRAANEAMNSAEEAGNIAEGLSKNNLDSKRKSFELRQDAHERTNRVANKLWRPLNESRDKMELLNHVLEESTQSNAKIDRELNDLLVRELQVVTETTVEAADRALVAANKALDDIRRLQDEIEIKNKEAKTLPKIYDEMKNDMKNSESYADRVISINPELKSLMEATEAKLSRNVQKGQEVDDQIAELKKRIALARGQANRIELGVKFYPDSTLQLRNPDNLAASGTYTKLALSFKTRDYNAMLAYIGNPVSYENRRRRDTNDMENEIEDSNKPAADQGSLTDFMALEIRNTRVYLTMDLGSGVETLTNELFVSDNKWYDIVVERVGKTVTLTVDGGDTKETAEGLLPGTHSVFDLDPVNSKIFVGGIPKHVKLQPEIVANQFNGSMEKVSFGDTPLGLWNFVEGYLNTEGVETREPLDSGPNGLRFDGNSYVILPRLKHDFRRETYVKLNFKTYAKAGLLFLVGQMGDYLAVYLEGGHLRLIYSLGSGYTQLKSPGIYNDGNWHTVDVARQEKEGVLKVDGIEVDNKMGIGLQTELDTDDNIYIGGFPGDHNYPLVTNMDFEGCIGEVQIGNKKINLSNNKEASQKVIKGCPDSVSREASFTNMSIGYIEMPLTDNINEYAQVTLKFRTGQPSGLLFYTSSKDQASHLAIYLSGGSLIMKAQPGDEIRTEITSYNDEEWHYVTATKDQNQIRLDVDDSVRDSVQADTPGVNALSIDSKTMFFGGVPPELQDSLSIYSIPTVFVGCFGDTTVNGKFQNFANTQTRPGASLASCPFVESADGVTTHSDSSPKPDTPEMTTKAMTSTTTVAPTPALPTGCKLPMVPEKEVGLSPEKGLRFGNSQHARHELFIRSSVVSNLLDESEFGLDFKTSYDSGVLLYVNDAKFIDFIALYMNEGKLFFSFNCGGGSTIIKTENTYNDSEWHTVVINRQRRSGYIRVDGGKKFSNHSPGDESSLNVRSPIFVGGLTEEVARGARNNLRSTTNSFPGCLRNLIVQNVPQILGVDLIAYDTTPCSDNVEPGAFFYLPSPQPSPLHSTGGLLTLKDRFRVGLRITIEFQIKPRHPSGILLAVHGPRDYLVLQLVDGAVKFNVENGAGEMVASYIPTEPNFLCDGEWHTIQAVKEGNLATLTVDNESQADVGVAFGKGGVSKTDTNNALYMGGVPDDQKSKPGLETTANYVGCIRDLDIPRRQVSIKDATVTGHVSLNSCPTI